MSDSSDQRTEQPTARKRQSARQQGQVARSGELVGAGVLLAVAATLGWQGTSLAAELMRGLRTGIVESPGFLETGSAQPVDLVQETTRSGLRAASLIWPVALMAVLAALVANVAQFGFLFAPQILTPDPSRLSLWSGLRRQFSLSSFSRGSHSLAKVGLVAGMVTWLGWAFIEESWRAADSVASSSEDFSVKALWQVVTATAGAGLDVLLFSAIGLVVLGIADHFVGRWKLERSLRMTPDEVRNEQKQDQASAPVRQEMRRRQSSRPMSQTDKWSAVDLVIVGAQQQLVAVRYEPGSMTSPEIARRESRLLEPGEIERLQILGVPVVEDTRLATELLNVTDEIVPTHCYHQLAQLLAQHTSGK